MNEGREAKSNMHRETAKVCHTNEPVSAVVPAMINAALRSDEGCSGVLQANELRTGATPRKPKTGTNKTEHKTDAGWQP